MLSNEQKRHVLESKAQDLDLKVKFYNEKLHEEFRCIVVTAEMENWQCFQTSSEGTENVCFDVITSIKSMKR